MVARSGTTTMRRREGRYGSRSVLGVLTGLDISVNDSDDMRLSGWVASMISVNQCCIHGTTLLVVYLFRNTLFMASSPCQDIGHPPLPRLLNVLQARNRGRQG